MLMNMIATYVYFAILFTRVIAKYVYFAISLMRIGHKICLF